MLTVGAFVRRCPTAQGEVAGDFIYDLSFEQKVGEGERASTLHIRHQLQATLKGQVGADGRLEKVDIDASIVLERAETGHAPSQRRKRVQASFVPNRNAGGLPTKISVGSESPWNTPGDDVADGGNGGGLFAASMLFSGQTYAFAETEWNQPNTCVEVKFNPATTAQLHQG